MEACEARINRLKEQAKEYLRNNNKRMASLKLEEKRAEETRLDKFTHGALIYTQAINVIVGLLDDIDLIKDFAEMKEQLGQTGQLDAMMDEQLDGLRAAAEDASARSAIMQRASVLKDSDVDNELAELMREVDAERFTTIPGQENAVEDMKLDAGLVGTSSTTTTQSEQLAPEVEKLLRDLGL